MRGHISPESGSGAERWGQISFGSGEVDAETKKRKEKEAVKPKEERKSEETIRKEVVQEKKEIVEMATDKVQTERAAREVESKLEPGSNIEIQK